MFVNWLLTSLLCLLFRRLALAEENTELTQTARLAQVFNSVCRQVMEYKGKKRLCLRKCKTCRSVISCVSEFIQAILPHVNFT